MNISSTTGASGCFRNCRMILDNFWLYTRDENEVSVERLLGDRSPKREALGILFCDTNSREIFRQFSYNTYIVIYSTHYK